MKISDKGKGHLCRGTSRCKVLDVFEEQEEDSDFRGVSKLEQERDQQKMWGQGSCQIIEGLVSHFKDLSFDS